MKATPLTKEDIEVFGLTYQQRELIKEACENLKHWAYCNFCDKKPKKECFGRHAITIPYEAIEKSFEGVYDE